MLDLCSEEIVSLDPEFSVNKSVTLRVGPRRRSLCVPHELGSTASRFEVFNSPEIVASKNKE